jgi:AcrR family transcriptional regulator
MPKTPEQYKQVREQKKELIIDAALHLFAEKGYHNTSINKIALNAKVSKGLMYNYFESKEDLLKQILKSFFEMTWKYFDPNHDGILTDEEFYFFIEQNFEVVAQNPVHWKLYMALAIQPDVLKIIETESAEFGGKVISILHNFFKNKKCDDPEIEIYFFSSLLKGAIIQFIAVPDIFPRKKIQTKIIDFYKQKFQL